MSLRSDGSISIDLRLRLDRGEPGRAISAATRDTFYVPTPGGLAYDFLIDRVVTPSTPSAATAACRATLSSPLSPSARPIEVNATMPRRAQRRVTRILDG